MRAALYGVFVLLTATPALADGKPKAPPPAAPDEKEEAHPAPAPPGAPRVRPGYEAMAAEAAEPPPLFDDRPGLGNSAGVVGKGVLQMELGVNFARDEAEGAEIVDVTAPSLLVRYGVTRGLELRFREDGLIAEHRGTEGAAENLFGFSDAAIGAKYELLDAHKDGMALSLFAELEIPTFDPDFSRKTIDGEIAVITGAKLPAGFGVVAEFGGAFPEEEEGRTIELLGAAELEYAVVDEKLEAYVEGFFTSPLAEGAEGVAVTVDGGVVYDLSHNIKLDLSGGAALTEAAPDFFVTGGVAFRAFLKHSPYAHHTSQASHGD